MLWIDAQSIFGLLSVAQQWELHEFYEPSCDIGFDEFELHLAALKRDKPSLANNAGKRFRRLEVGFCRALFPWVLARRSDSVQESAWAYLLTVQPVEPTIIRKGGAKPKRVIVPAVAMPEPDVRKLALIELATVASLHSPNE